MEPYEQPYDLRTEREREPRTNKGEQRANNIRRKGEHRTNNTHMTTEQKANRGRENPGFSGFSPFVILNKFLPSFGLWPLRADSEKRGKRKAERGGALGLHLHLNPPHQCHLPLEPKHDAR